MRVVEVFHLDLDKNGSDCITKYCFIPITGQLFILGQGCNAISGQIY